MLLSPWQNNTSVIPELVNWVLQQFLARSALQSVVGNGRQLLQCISSSLRTIPLFLPVHGAGGVCMHLHEELFLLIFSSSSLDYEYVEVKRLHIFNKNS